MANYEDYLPKGKNDPNATADGIQEEIDDAAQVQAAREDPSTPKHNWEERFKNLEQLNSQQAQTLGSYRKIIDEFIVNPTSAAEPTTPEESTPITSDDLWEKPDEVLQKAINSALSNHPAIQEATKLKETLAETAREQSVASFKARHPDFEEITEKPEFTSWVQETDTRLALAQAADNYDMNSADALFSLYKAEKGLTKKITQDEETKAIQAASLEDSSNAMLESQVKYSRSEFINKKMRAEQGDREAETWINNNVASYREALASGNVRD